MVSEQKRETILPRHLMFDQMTWPRPDTELEWTLRYGKPTEKDIMLAASICAAYAALVYGTQRRRNQIISTIRRLIESTRKAQ
jgi:hypothetical protein